MAPPIGPTITWSKPWCFALALAVEHQMPQDGDSTTTNWNAVTSVLNEIFKSDATFARDFPTGTRRTKYQTQWSERDRGKTSKWRFDVLECSASEIVDMNAIRDIVFATEHRLSLQLNSEVQAPDHNSISWPVYRPEDRESRLEVQKNSTLKAKSTASVRPPTQTVAPVSTGQRVPKKIGRPRKHKIQEDDDAPANLSKRRVATTSTSNSLITPMQPAAPKVPRLYMGDGILEDLPAVEHFSWEAFKREHIIALHDRDSRDWYIVNKALSRTPGFVPRGEPNMTNLTRELAEPLSQSTGKSLQEVIRATRWATDRILPMPMNFHKIALAPTMTGADEDNQTPTAAFNAIIHEIQVFNGGGLAMVHSKDVDFSSGRPICVTRSGYQPSLSHPGAPSAFTPINQTYRQIHLVPARSELRSWGGEVRRVLFQDNITGQSQEVDIMLCDQSECSTCGPGEHPGRRSDPKNNFQALPLVHRKDIVWLEDGITAFAPIDQVPVGKPPRVMNCEVYNIVFNGESDISANEEQKTTKAIICDYFEHEDPDDVKCPSCLAFTVTLRDAHDKEQARLAQEGLVEEDHAEEGHAIGGHGEDGLADDGPAAEVSAAGGPVEEESLDVEAARTA